MTLQNITISTPNNSDLYFLKADGSDFIQAPISETTHIGVLRYAPTEAGTYQGEVYANASALKQYQKFPVALTVLNVLTVDVFVSITDPSDDPDYAGWFQVGKGLSVVGTEFGLLESDVPVGTNIWVMVRDSVNAGVYDIAQSGVMSLVLTSPLAGTSFVYRSDITVEWEASANIPLVNIIIESATGIKTVSNIDATLGTYDVPMIADSGSFDFGQELVITVENSLQTIADSVTVEIRQATLQDFRIEESESEYRVAEDIHFTAYVNYGNLPSIWAVYAQYSSDGITYEDIQSATVGGSGLANITGCLIPVGASGTIYLRARVGDVYSDPIEATVVTPEITITPVAVTVDVPFTISGTCNLAKNLRISYAKDPYSSWTWVDNSVTVQPNGTWSVEGVVISETGNFRLKAEYIQDTVSMFSDTEDVVVSSAVVLTALQITNSADAATKGNIHTYTTKIYGDNVLFAIGTNSSKINIKGTDYETGVDADFTYTLGLVSMTKKHEINWVKFFKRRGREGVELAQAFDTDANYIYTNEHFKSGNYYRTYIRRLNPGDGSTQASLALTAESNVAVATGIAITGGTIHCFGTNEQGGYNIGSAYRWSTSDFATITVRGYGDSSSQNRFRNTMIDGQGRCFTDFWGNCFDTVSLSSYGTYKSTAWSTVYPARAAGSANRIFFCAYDSTDNQSQFIMRRADVAIDNVSYFDTHYKESYYDAVNNVGACDYDGTDFNAFFFDGTKMIIRKVQDASTYAKVGNDKEKTPASVTTVECLHISQDAEHYVVGGAVKGNIETGFTPDDTAKRDAFVMLVAK